MGLTSSNLGPIAENLDFKETNIFASPVNLRKESLHLKYSANDDYSLMFSFDSTAKVNINVVFLGETFNSSIDEFGLRQTFVTSVKISDKKSIEEKFPLVVILSAVGDKNKEVCQTTCCSLLLIGTTEWIPHVEQQSLKINSRIFEYYDLFGLEDTGLTECVVCLTEPRSVTVLPCRHLCLCRNCSDVIRASPLYQQKCPICRSMAGRLLGIQKKEAHLI